MSPAAADTAVMIACGLALLAAMTVAQAQALADPTKPPASIEKPVAAEAAEAKPAPAGLQSVILRAGGKPAAIINGEYVVLGGRLGEARLVKISEDSVTLKSAAGRETLRLMPGVEKTPVAPARTGEKKAAGKAAGKEAKK
ncbi:MAG: hypothetical protein HZC24_09590 [Rhodocyclales bacterium]|nr:hypothetical protein [Rhodocyclales bacterium]